MPADGARRGSVVGVAGLIFLVVVALFAACRPRRTRAPSGPPPEHPFIREVRARAPFDLGCAAEQVNVVGLSEQTFGATGCGRRASYACLCTYHVWGNCKQALCSLDGVTASPAPAVSTPPAPAPS